MDVPAALAVRGLSKSYARAGGGEQPAERLSVLQDVSLHVETGEFVSLLGPSGGGKSTLLNVLAGLERPDAGEARVAGRSVQEGRPPIAYMQQKDLLLPWRTLWDNVLLGPELRSAAEARRLAPTAEALLQAYGLDAFRHTYPAQLSGGMRQRAALVRTLLCEQDILLLDEPFGALDAFTRGRLQQHLLGVWREYGKTVLLVTHDVEEAVLLSTRIVLLTGQPGRITGELNVPLPHEARPDSPETLRLRRRILALLEQPQ